MMFPVKVVVSVSVFGANRHNGAPRAGPQIESVAKRVTIKAIRRGNRAPREIPRHVCTPPQILKCLQFSNIVLINHEVLAVKADRET